MEHHEKHEKDEKKVKEKHGKKEYHELEEEVKVLQSDLEKKENEAKEIKELAQRIKAEFDNYKKRILKDYEENCKLASESLIRDLLPVLDSFERALNNSSPDDDKLKSVYTGMGLIFKKFQEVLINNGLKEVLPVSGDSFDPAFHEALLAETREEYQDDIILEVFEKGYLLSSKLLRPAKVKVGKPLVQQSEAVQENLSQAIDQEAGAVDDQGTVQEGPAIQSDETKEVH